MTDEEQAWLDQLERWMSADADIRRLVVATLNEHDCPDTRRLLSDHIQAFEDVYEAIEELVTDIPEEDLTRWM